MASTASETPSVSTALDASDWQSVIADAVRDASELCRLLGLDVSLAAASSFPVLVPRTFLARIRPGDPDDPLLRQVLPLAAEQDEVPGFHTDPLGEAAATVAPGLLQKYPGRSLMVTTGACGVHCRYCFRRHLRCRVPPPVEGNWRPAVDRIAADRSIHEVILSGGDPLTLSDVQLCVLADRLSQIPHLRRLRIHTRLPVAIPQRVGSGLMDWLRGSRLSTIIVVQVNHPAEIDRATATALGRLVDAGVPVLNQAVLLRGVNDHADVLAELCERLVDLRVMPYYLHQLDPVSGASHFEVPEAKGIRLIDELRRCLPGYAVPRYVREMPGGASKAVICGPR